MQKVLKAAGVTILVIVCGLAAFLCFEAHQNQKQRRIDEAAFDKKFSALSNDLRVGMSRHDVFAYAASHDIPLADDYSTEVEAQLQSIQSTEWYCSRWNGYAGLRFSGTSESSQLLSITQGESGAECL